MKYAVLSMDIEDWYHLDYFEKRVCDTNYSMLDGIDIFRHVLSDYDIKSTFFTLGEISKSIKHVLKDLDNDNHEISAHGWSHQRPLTMDKNNFLIEIAKAKETIENIVGKKVLGYRAPCFSLNREYLDIVEMAGFNYDSSRIDFSRHPLYGSINMEDYTQLLPSIFTKKEFFEFEVSTYSFKKRSIPISGGGYIRIFPWFVMQKFLKEYLSQNSLYVLYIHPFELSKKENPKMPNKTPYYIKKRFGIGRSSVKNKLRKLILLLQEMNYTFLTFSELRQTILYNKHHY